MSYTITFKMDSDAYRNAHAIYVNDSLVTTSLTNGKTFTVGVQGTLRIVAQYGTVYLNGTSVGQDYTLIINSDVTVELTREYSAYIATEGSSGDDTGGSGGGHKAMINGTAYEITGGRAMVSGTVYDIATGKVLVDGTVFEIAFGPGSFTLNITGSGVLDDAEITLAKVSIDGNDYADAATVTVGAGTEVVFTVSGTAYGKTNYIYLDGVVVAQAGKNETGTYTMVMERNVSVKLTIHNPGNLTSLYATIEITTE